MPKPRSYGALESPVYGNVLWIPLDHGAIRIGFALNEGRRQWNSELSRDVFAEEAKLSVAPFTIEYDQVDWANVYSVGQRVAKKFFTKDCIFLAGVACHTHSS
jgi:phenol 2-monooxygenase (NADPH)